MLTDELAVAENDFHISPADPALSEALRILDALLESLELGLEVLVHHSHFLDDVLVLCSENGQNVVHNR